MEIKLIERENIPCWYELFFGNRPLRFILRVHNDFANNFKVYPDNSPVIEGYKKDFGFNEFSGSLAGDFGFDKAFKIIGNKKDFIEFEIKIPQIAVRTEESCSDCGGLGRDPFCRDGKCYHCKGSGKNYIYNHKIICAISASFSIFLRFSEFTDQITSASDFQLLTVGVSVTKEKSFHGAPLCGRISAILCNWLRGPGRDENRLSVVKANMKKVYSYITNRRSDKHGFRVLIEEDGLIYFSCPGDCACLGASPGVTGGEGYEFNSHNVDNVIQQITLLSGVATLIKLARDDMRK